MFGFLCTRSEKDEFIKTVNKRYDMTASKYLRELLKAVNENRVQIIPPKNLVTIYTNSEFKEHDNQLNDNNKAIKQPTIDVELTKPTSQQVTSKDVDSRGWHWDERIHTKTKTKSKNMQWKKIRQLTTKFPNKSDWDQYVLNVEEELKQNAKIKQQLPPGLKVNNIKDDKIQPITNEKQHLNSESITLEQLKAAIRLSAKSNNADSVISIIQRYASSVNQLVESQYTQVYYDLKLLTND